MFLQGGKKQWILESVGKASVKSIIEAHIEYKQLELNENGEKTRNALDKHVIGMYFSCIFQVARIRDVRKLEQDTGNEAIIKDHLANLLDQIVF